ncbi:MAG: hypothetical protein ACLPKT_06585 [Methylocella sp.]
MLDIPIKVDPPLGPLLSGIGLCLGATAAWVTYAFYYRRTMNTAWLERYRTLYAEFWKDPRMGDVRTLISSEVEYEKVAKILGERLKTDKKRLNADDNRILEQIDYFCSVFMRIRFIDRGKMTREQRILWNTTFGNYWAKKIGERKELSAYINKYWPNVHIEKA